MYTEALQNGQFSNLFSSRQMVSLLIIVIALRPTILVAVVSAIVVALVVVVVIVAIVAVGWVNSVQ
ncbi:MAG: hypothetical protein DMG50_00835 [Acidobacteria bacterium]|nr:MAG: hypothetical protein DMG50_00835 [Acidobacteriota bacterium]